MRILIALLAGVTLAAQQPTTLNYHVEWRLVHAGDVRLGWQPLPDSPTAGDVNLHLETTGLVARLFKVDNNYRAKMAPGYCSLSSAMDIHEASRHRQTQVIYDREKKRAFFLERDLVKNAQVGNADVETPACVHDVVAGLMALRKQNLQPGQSLTVPISDGKKFANVRIDAQEKETVKTPAGNFSAIRYEVMLMNGVIYNRSGRVFVWLTDDERRLPVQFRIRLQILVGTVTLQLAKEEHP